MKTEWTKTNISIAGGVVVSALLVLPNLGKGWEALRYVADAPATAYAARQEVKQVQQENQTQDRLLDRLTYIAEQNEQLQRQQMQQIPPAYPNAATPQRNLPNPAPPTWAWEQDEQGNWFCRYADGSWAWPTEKGSCE